MVLSSSIDDTHDQIAYCNELPGNFTKHPDDEKIYTEDRDATLSLENRGGNVIKWIVTIDYIPVPQSFQHNGSLLPPHLRPPEVDWPTVMIPEVVPFATRIFGGMADPNRTEIEDALVANSLGDKFDPPVEEDVPHLSLVYTRNELYYNSLFAKSFINSVNVDPFLGHGQYQAWCQMISAGKVKEDTWRPEGATEDIEIRYRPVTYVFVFANEGKTWVKALLNEGQRFKDSNGNPNTDPTGRKYNLKVSDSTILGEGSDPEYIEYLTKHKKQFSQLQITGV